MLKKSITYNDLDGNQITEDFYFNMTKAELAEMELSGPEGGLSAQLRNMLATGDRADIISTFKKIISRTVGRRSDDGKRFMKSDMITEEFMQTDAYSALFMELVTDAEASIAFIHGVIPSDVAKKITDVRIPEVIAVPDSTMALTEAPGTAETKPQIKHVSEYTHQELLAMTQEEFDAVAGTDPQKMSRAVLIIAMQRRVSS